MGYERFSSMEITLKANEDSPAIKIPFRAIQVLDYRNDTVCNGLEERTDLEKAPKVYFVFKKGASASVSQFIQENVLIDDKSNYTLVMIIRKLWGSLEYENPTVNDNDPRMQHQLLPGVKAIFEFYAEKDGFYTPVNRFDSVFVKGTHLYKIISSFFSNAILLAVKTTASTNLNFRTQKKNSYTFKQIDSFSSVLKRLPVLSETSYKKGVYKTFQEFLYNNPSIKEYELQKTKKADMLYIKNDQGEAIPTRKVWGFCDGEFIYINSQNIFFPLQFYKGNFYSNATRQLSRTKNANIGAAFGAAFLSTLSGSNVSAPRWKYDLKIITQLMQLDLQTGILY